MNKKFNTGDEAICTWGLNSGKKLKIESKLNDRSYSCSLVDKKDGKFYKYRDWHLV